MFFFFKQKTAYDMRISDWSSDVCSSDLDLLHEALDRHGLVHADHGIVVAAHAGVALIDGAAGEDHRVGGRHMSVGPDAERDPAVDAVAGGHLPRCRLGMEIQHRGIYSAAETVPRQTRGQAGEGGVDVPPARRAPERYRKSVESGQRENG